jgi:DNA-binding MarR family transcriptional regulator
MTIKLTDTQLVLMSAAAQREDRCLILPEKLTGSVVAKLAAKLAEAGLVRKIKARPGMPIWRRDDDQRCFALKLTPIGLNAIALDDDPAVGASEERSREGEGAPEQIGSRHAVGASPDVRSTAPRVGSKLALVIELLQRDGGATIGDLTEATGWLPHTTRAAITGLRKRGYSVMREKREDGASGYRISTAPIEGADPRPDDTGAAPNGMRQVRARAKKAA